MLEEYKTMLKDLAHTLLTDAVFSEMEEEYPELRSLHIRPQIKLKDELDKMARQYKLNLDDYLPIELVQIIVEMIDRKWKTVTMLKLYEYDPDSAHREILAAVGHGVSAWDDFNIAEWLENRGAFRPRFLFSGPYNEAYDFLQACQAKLEGEDNA